MIYIARTPTGAPAEVHVDGITEKQADYLERLIAGAERWQ